MDYKLGLLILGIILFLWAKFKTVFFKAKDVALTQDDEVLRSKANSIKTEIDKLKVEVPTKPMEPDAVEAYWNKDEKKS